MYEVLAPEMVMSTVYCPAACSLRRRLASSLLEPPRYSMSMPNAFLNASGTCTRASGLGPVARTSLPSFFAPAIQLSHCCCQSAGAPSPLPAGLAGLAATELGEAGAAVWPQADRARLPRPATAAARKARRFI